MARLRANGGNAKKTALELGVALTTLRGWAGRQHPTNGTPKQVPEAEITAKAQARANRFDEITDKIHDRVMASIDAVPVATATDVRNMLVGAGITTEKASFSRGGPTSRVESMKISLISPNALRDPKLTVIEGGKQPIRERDAG
jgi:hypothetical protein